MAFEVACSQCQGRLMVEQPGVIVACPHCGAHLTIEAPPEADASPQISNSEASSEQPAADAAPVVDEASMADRAATADEGQQPTHTEPPATASADTPVEPDATPAEIPGEQMPYLGDVTTPPIANGVIANETPADSAATALPVATDPVTPPASPTDQAPAAAEPQQASPDSATTDTGYGESVSVSSVAGGRGVSRHTFTLLRNYAIAVTIAVIILVVRMLNPNTSDLESLPDVKPPKKKDGTIGYKQVLEAAEMPPGHLLSLGQSQRFGNLQVTPVRVTKEPVEFVHHLGDASVNREPGPDIVKLWFEFENVSSDQSIAPLDGLVFRRDDNDFGNVRSNNFVCRQSEKKKGGKLVFVYDLNEFDIWNLRGQNVDVEIAPGEKIETYIPTSEEGIAQLLNSDEPLVWRVHFRKGYSRKNYGVTTVIEVAFNSSDIGAASITPAETKGGST